MLETLVSIIHILVVLFLIFVVLVQGGNQGGVGAALGGGSNTGSAFGATGAMSLLGKMTYGAATIFMITTLSLAVMQGGAGEKGIADELSKMATPPPATTEPAENTPAVSPAPAEQNAPEEAPQPEQ